MLHIVPEAEQTHAADCAACASLQSQTGFDQFDAVHAVVVVNISRRSFLPNAMRLKWTPSSSKAQLTSDLAKVHCQLLHCVHTPALCTARTDSQTRAHLCNATARLSLWYTQVQVKIPNQKRRLTYLQVAMHQQIQHVLYFHSAALKSSILYALLRLAPTGCFNLVSPQPMFDTSLATSQSVQLQS